MHGNTPTNITLERKISTPTDGGKMLRTTARYGCQMSRMDGLRIVMATGPMSLTTVGRGLAMSLGDGRLITMDAGCGTEIRGRGGRDRCGAGDSTVRSGRQRMCRSLDSEGRGASALGGEDGAALDGCRLGLVIASFRGGADMADGLGASGLNQL